MSVSTAGLTGTPGPIDEPMTQPASAAPSVGASSGELLITTQQVLFSTAARGVRRESTAGRFGGVLRRFFGPSLDDSRPRPHYEPKRYAFLEGALMAREMDRL